jgi:hypothetical protein
VRYTYDSASFTPRGIYGITENVFGTLAAAGFNTAMVAPLYPLNLALADAAPHGVQAVACFSHAGGRPIVGRLAGGSADRFGTWAAGGRNVWLDTNGDGNADNSSTIDPGDVPFMGGWNADAWIHLRSIDPRTGAFISPTTTTTPRRPIGGMARSARRRMCRSQAIGTEMGTTVSCSTDPRLVSCASTSR